MKCPICNLEFVSRYKSKVFCTVRCRDTHFRIKYKDKRNKTISEWQKNNKEKRNLTFKKWRDKNVASERQRLTEYQKENLSQYAFHSAKRRALKKQATPKWLSESQWDEVKSIYNNCPTGYEVDHIIPLKNDFVCGLHVPWNLQYLTKFDNISKLNRWKI